MSASLVGSEMCIRDRHRSLSLLVCAPGSPGRGQLQHFLEGRALAAVSYTHLTLPTICSV
eukprot:870655-Alexandrium_andersonii.AAC.1